MIMSIMKYSWGTSRLASPYIARGYLPGKYVKTMKAIEEASEMKEMNNSSQRP